MNRLAVLTHWLESHFAWDITIGGPRLLGAYKLPLSLAEEGVRDGDEKPGRESGRDVRG